VSAPDVSRVLRPGLLEGVRVLLATADRSREGGEELGDAVERACTALGATVSRYEPPAGAAHEEQEREADGAAGSALAEMEGIDMLVVDAAAVFAGAGESPDSGLGACLQATWAVTRAVFNLAFLAGERGGRIVYLAPPHGAGERSGPALAGLENLSRTLSIEWARHGVTAVTIAPGAATTPGEVGALAAYLASPAGAYFSGCLLDLAGA
jgi:NAD(P)-dependent dehydrogenase (short-subunit alcohol dehydrogenase family)